MILVLAPVAAAQSTAGFPPVPGSTPSPPPRLAPPPYPAPAPAPAPYSPPPYPAPASYSPPPYPAPAPYSPPPYPAPTQGYPQGGSPYPPGYPYGYPPPPGSLAAEQRRYQQSFGAYQRTFPTPTTNAGASRPAYVRLADASRRRHDGFYFRFAGGIGIGRDAMQSDKVLPTTRELSFAAEPLDGSGSGLAPVTEVAVGFTPLPGFVLGAGVYTATITGLVASVKDPSTGDYAFRVSQLVVAGPLVDWYVDPKSGFHVEASPGVATYVAGVGEPRVEGAQAQANASVGFGFMLGTGYEWWIGDQWSLGLLGRFIYGTTKGTDNRGVGWSHQAYAPALLLSATYH